MMTRAPTGPASRLATQAGVAPAPPGSRRPYALKGPPNSAAPGAAAGPRSALTPSLSPWLTACPGRRRTFRRQHNENTWFPIQFTQKAHGAPGLRPNGRAPADLRAAAAHEAAPKCPTQWIWRRAPGPPRAAPCRLSRPRPVFATSRRTPPPARGCLHPRPRPPWRCRS